MHDAAALEGCVQKLLSHFEANDNAEAAANLRRDLEAALG
jgi:hypothetical protein